MRNFFFVFQFANLQYMLFRIITYIWKSNCARVKIYYEKLLQYNKAILKGDKAT